MPASPARELRVAVLARDPETLDGLTDYLRGAGARALPGRGLALSESAEVVVLFGDDFDSAASTQFVRQWTGARVHRSVLILVTGDDSLAESARSDPRAVVLRRPVWGWVLLAAIKSGLQRCARHTAMSERETPG